LNVACFLRDHHIYPLHGSRDHLFHSTHHTHAPAHRERSRPAGHGGARSTSTRLSLLVATLEVAVHPGATWVSRSGSGMARPSRDAFVPVGPLCSPDTRAVALGSGRARTFGSTGSPKRASRRSSTLSPRTSPAGTTFGSHPAWTYRARVVDPWGGIRNKATREPWEEDTVEIVFSTTKGLARPRDGPPLMDSD